MTTLMTWPHDNLFSHSHSRLVGNIGIFNCNVKLYSFFYTLDGCFGPDKGLPA